MQEFRRRSIPGALSTSDERKKRNGIHDIRIVRDELLKLGFVIKAGYKCSSERNNKQGKRVTITLDIRTAVIARGRCGDSYPLLLFCEIDNYIS